MQNLTRLTDAIGMYTKGKLCTYNFGYYGHKKSYCEQQGRWGATSETWATFFYTRTCASKDEIKVMKDLMPKTWGAMDKAFSDIASYCKTNNLT